MNSLLIDVGIVLVTKLIPIIRMQFRAPVFVGAKVRNVKFMNELKEMKMRMWYTF